MIELGSMQWWQILFGGIATLAIYSFLFKENTIYRMFEHFFIGMATAIGIFETIRTFLWPEILMPLVGADLVTFPDGTMPEPYNPVRLLMLLPCAFGLLYYFVYSKRLNWLAQLVIGFQFGCAGGLAFKGTFAEALPQIFDSFRPVYVPGDWQSSAENTFFLITLISVMTYFFFTFKRARGGVVARTSSVGRWLMMGCFGAFFGSTIMARMALLVDRLNFLIDKWIPAIAAIFGM